MRSFALQSLVFAAGTHALNARDVLNVDGNGNTCPAVPTTTIQIQPVFYSEYIPYNIVIDPFRNGHPITITNAPTTVVTAGQLTSTIYPGSTTGASSSSTTSAGASAASTSTSGASSTGTTSSTGTETTTGVSGSPTTATGFSNSTTTAPVTTTTGFANQTSLTFGAGLPNGPVTDLPTETFLVLAVATPGGGRKRDVADLERRQADLPTASACTVVNLSPSAVPGGVDQDNCDDSTALNLVGGRLVRGGRSIGKVPGSTSAEIGFLAADAPSTDTVFTLENGPISWNTPEGIARFYDCSGTIFAEFGDNDPAGCTRVAFGAVSGQSCADRIRANGGTPNPDFTDPAVPSSTTTSTSSTATDIVTDITTTTSTSSTATDIVTDITTTTSTSSTATDIVTDITTTTSLPTLPTTTTTSLPAVNVTLSSTTTTSSTTTSVLPTGTSTGPSNNTCAGLSPRYTAANSKPFDISCGTAQQGNLISTETAADFKACVDLCSITTTCVACNFDNESGVEDCSLYSSFDPSSTLALDNIDSATYTNGTVTRMRYMYH